MGKACSQDFFQFYWTLSPRCTIVQGSWRPRGVQGALDRVRLRM